jgi:hypothetical protein
VGVPRVVVVLWAVVGGLTSNDSSSSGPGTTSSTYLQEFDFEIRSCEVDDLTLADKAV